MLTKRIKKMENIKEQNKNLAKVSHSLLESFVRRNNTVGLKILMYIAKSSMPAEEIAELPDDKVIKITMSTKEFLSYTQMDIKTLKRNIELLTETSVRYRTDKGEGYVNILPKAHFDYNDGLTVQMYSEILKLTHSLSKYAVIDVSQIMQIDGKHSIRMLLLLERIANFSPNVAKRMSFELEELNLLFDTKYTKFSEFERAVLKPSKEELDKTSKRTFTYVIEKDKLDKSRGRAKCVKCTIDLVSKMHIQGTLI